MAQLRLEEVSKSFGTVVAVNPLSLDINDGELVCLLGPSGSGKSTLLRMIGGFEDPTSGRIFIGPDDVANDPPEKRPTAMVFQSHALWSHMNVFENVAFGLKLRSMPKKIIKEKVTGVLELVGLGGYETRNPNQLSGGQRQRVAIARCLVLEPKILLMDEPFASLDQHLRERLREEVRQIQRKLGITTVFVTHGQDEALALADRIVVMSMGRIEQMGTPREIYSHPASEFVAGFIGAMNMSKGEAKGGAITSGCISVQADVPDGAVTLAVRPEDISIDPAGVPVTVRRLVNQGAFLLAETEHADGTALVVNLPKDYSAQEGDSLNLRVSRFHVYRDEKLIFQS